MSPHFTLPPIYPITDTLVSGLSHPEQVRRLASGGATLIQLREKYASAREFYAAGLDCMQSASPAGVRLIINDRVDIALALNAEGVHLGQDDMPPAMARKLLGPDAIIGYSTHSVEQALRATERPVDYIAIGPIFATETKERPDPVVGLDGLRRLKAAVPDLPLVAIGGIDANNLEAVLASGADSAAMISGLVGRGAEITATMAELITRASK